MGFGANSLRYRKMTLQKISSSHKQMLKNVGNYEEMIKYSDAVSDLYFKYYNDCDLGSPLKKEDKDQFYRDVDKIIVDNFRSWAHETLASGLMTIEFVRETIYTQPFMEDTLLTQLEIIVEHWVMIHRGPVVPLSAISGDRQSIHVDIVEDATEKGIRILGEVEVPRGQKTIAEIEAAFERFGWNNVLGIVIEDMKDWGSRDQVMDPHENLYRKVLRGLWAKIKMYEGEVRDELVKRLWEECQEAVDMCADGHVGRLVNVLNGFDDRFGSQISRMEYFQNNIALIAENDLAPREAKIQHAVKLMDEMGMPEEEREAWLEAL